jgi:hypothetical protein
METTRILRRDYGMNDKKMLTWDEVSSFASGKFDVWANMRNTVGRKSMEI